MGAYINALREEGTRADLLREIERLLDERDRLRDALRAAAEGAGYVLCRRGDPNDPRRRVVLDDDDDDASLKGGTPETTKDPRQPEG